MKTELKEFRIFVCETCGEEYISMEDVPKKCLKSTIIDFTDGVEEGNAVCSTLLGIECGFELIGCVLEIQDRGHEKGLVVKNYLSNSTIYLGESNHKYWYVLSDAKLDAWRRMINEN